MKPLLIAMTMTAGLCAGTPAALAQSIDIGPGGVRVDPRSPREREIDAVRREERREEFREERRDAIRREERRRDLNDDLPPPRRY